MTLTAKLTEQFAEFWAKQQELNVHQDDLSKRISCSFPDILNHFNSFVENEINPKLPEGYKLDDAIHICYDPSCAKCVITTGLYLTPKGKSHGPMEFQDIILPMLEKYAERYKVWIKEVEPGFDIGGN
jgi:hypothetical protein